MARITIKELQEKLEKAEETIKAQEEEIARLKAELEERSQIKTAHNERGAGRKAFSDIDTIKLILDKHNNGESLQKIADYLNEQKLKTKRGGKWSKSSVKFILDNNKLDKTKKEEEKPRKYTRKEIDRINILRKGLREMGHTHSLTKPLEYEDEDEDNN